jgi:hypothetical protein
VLKPGQRLWLASFEATTTLSDMLDVVIPWIRQALADGNI